MTSLPRTVDRVLLRTAARLADKVRNAIRASANPETIVDDFLRTHNTGFAISRAQARTWARMSVRFDRSRLANVLDEVWATGWLLGRDYADAAIQEAKTRKAASVTFDWTNWKPGDELAATLVRPPGGLKKLQNTARSRTIDGLTDTSLDRIGTILADGLAGGEGGESIARSFLMAGIENLLLDAERALSIAITESSRAVSVATMDRYGEYGVEMVEWFALEGCDYCEQNAENGPIPLGNEFPSGDTEPPAHPNCRCTILPFLPYDSEPLREQPEPAMAFDDGELVDPLELAVAPSLVKYDPDQPRDENGRFGSGVGNASVFPAAEARAASDRLSAAEKNWPHEGAIWVKDENGNNVLDRTQSTPEAIAAYDEVRAAGLALWGSSVSNNEAGEKVLSVEGQWLTNNFVAFDKDGNPLNLDNSRYGLTEEQWKVRDRYVVPDDKTLEMNAALRDGENPSRASGISAWVNRYTLTNDTVFYRGAVLTPEQVSTLQPGFSYVDRGFQSSGGEERTASGYLSSRMRDAERAGEIVEPVMMRYVVEAGTHVAPAGYDEYVVQRNTTNTVVGVNSEEGVTYVTMRVNGNG